MNIPDGWTYIRCDRYTLEEFRNLYASRGKIANICEEYIANNPKDIYNTDDEIAIHEIVRERFTPGLLHGQNRPTTKRTWYTDR